MILALESSGQTASVAVVENGVVLCESSISTGLFHSQTLMVILQNLLKQAKINPSLIKLVAVSTGPGSFTGIRIGVSAAKGLSRGFGVSCVGVSSLRGLAANLMGLPVYVCAVIDARNDYVYFSVFDVFNDGCTRLTDDDVVLVDNLPQKLSGLQTNRPVFFVGDGAQMCYLRLKTKMDGLNVASGQLQQARAASIALCAEFDLKHQQLDFDCEIHYLRQPQAQRMLNEKLNKNEER